MNLQRFFYCIYRVLIGLWMSSLVACNPATLSPTTPPVVETQAAVISPTTADNATPTLIQPSPTPQLAAIVNGEAITLAEFQEELERFKAAANRALTAEDEQRVLDELVDERLFAQAAAENGYTVDEATLQERLDQLVADAGGEQALSDWIAAYGFTQESFRAALKISITAAWMRDQVIAEVPLAAEQVHARQILVTSPEQADEALAQLQAGNDFGNLAAQYNPVTGGDLGWFPRGYLLDEKLEQAAFELQVEEYTPVIQTLAGYHILQVIERQAERPLEPDMLLTLQMNALQAWLEVRRSQSDIQYLVP